MNLNMQNENAVAPAPVKALARRPIFVTVHTQYRQCADGFEDLGAVERHVIAGEWPFGRFGNRNMGWQAGSDVGGRFSSRFDAGKWAKEYAAARGERFHYVESSCEARTILEGEGLVAPKWND